jgi:hypothetical protein
MTVTEREGNNSNDQKTFALKVAETKADSGSAAGLSLPSGWLDAGQPCHSTGVPRSYEIAQPLRSPQEPGRGPTAGSYGVAFSYERGTPVLVPVHNRFYSGRRPCEHFWYQIRQFKPLHVSLPQTLLHAPRK